MIRMVTVYLPICTVIVMGICLTSSAERMGGLNRLPYAQRLSGPIRGKIRILYPAVVCQFPRS